MRCSTPRLWYAKKLDGAIALIGASQEGFVEVVIVLLAHGAAVNSKTARVRQRWMQQSPKVTTKLIIVVASGLPELNIRSGEPPSKKRHCQL
jgi:hypothetical protein